MPRISRYYGISIYMYFRDHSPPHFHAIYGEHEAVFEIATAKLLDGDLPRRASKLVIEWAKQHRLELMENWRRAQSAEALELIEPLE